MKNWVKILSVILLSIMMVACGKKDDREPVRRGKSRDRGATTSTRSGSYTTHGKGTIRTHQEALDIFISVAGNPSDLIGYIDASGTGVSFEGSATHDSNGSYGSIRSANIEIKIIDDRAADGDEDPYIVPGFDFRTGSIDSQYDADIVRIEFYDDEYDQYLTLVGEVPHQSNGQFHGKMYFKNMSMGVVTNNNYAEGELLGEFTIPACSFFDCR